MMEILATLQKQVAYQLGFPVDIYYMEGYGALAVPRGYKFHPSHVVFAFPDIAIVGWQ